MRRARKYQSSNLHRNALGQLITHPVNRSTAPEIRNAVLLTALDNGLVTLNFNSTVADYASHQAILEQS